MVKESPKTIYLNYYDSITDIKIKSVMEYCFDILKSEKPDILYFLLSSSGGHVEAGITLYNFLISLPVEIIMHNTASVDSIANVIFLSGKQRFCCPYSSFLFHGISQGFDPNVSYSRTQIVETLSQFNISEERISGIIAERTRLTADEIRTLFQQGETKNAKFALEKGIVDEVKNVVIPPNSICHAFNLS